MEPLFYPGEEECSYMQSFLKTPSLTNLTFDLLSNIINILNGFINPFKFYQKFPCLFMTLIAAFSLATLSIMKINPEKSDKLLGLFIPTVYLLVVNLTARLKFDIMPFIYRKQAENVYKVNTPYQNPIFTEDYDEEFGEDVPYYSNSQGNRRKRQSYKQKDYKEELTPGSNFRTKGKQKLYVKILNTLILLSLLFIICINFYFIYTDQKDSIIDNLSLIGIGISIFSFVLVYYKDVMIILETLFVNLFRIFNSFYKVSTGSVNLKKGTYYKNPEFSGKYDEDLEDSGGYSGYTGDPIERQREIQELSAESNIFNPDWENPLYTSLDQAQIQFGDLTSDVSYNNSVASAL